MTQYNEERDVVTLYDENENAQDFEIVDVFEYNESVYAAVTPLQDEYDENIPLDVTMLKVTEVDGEEIFSFIETEEEEEEAFNELLRREEEFDND
ncbi:MAG: DUF1292 domain-containing protein [Clostridia bacterium]|nr:DUF1292 domain-containing protein [Oscillospiraceae bacterium]MBR4892372.1 DUF1292 domain-containing protein [Clostridia bacterium]